LVQGLAHSVQRLGVVIHENTLVTEIRAGGRGRPAVAVTERGTVRAAHVLRATEGFTANLAQAHPDWLPINSSTIVSEPLDSATWAGIGWEGCETLEDLAHAYVYLQRTHDGRIGIGGRGVPCRFGSHTDMDGATQPKTIKTLTGILHSMFPAAAGARIDHAWSGVLGVPRDWKASVNYDPSTRLGFAGGYVGTGVAATNLAGRTLSDLVLCRGAKATSMPWVNRGVRRWEPEPLRWIAVQAMYAMYHRADAQENTGRRTTSPLALLADKVSGRQ
jgi:glycine/D-amino acid oxidase-like deaminating enzyme